GLPEHYTFCELTETNSASPVQMSIPTNISKILWVKYDKILDGETNPNYEEIKFLSLRDFLNRMNSLNIDESHIETYDITMNGENFVIKYPNDRGPVYYTILGDDSTIIFDSYDSSVE